MTAIRADRAYAQLDLEHGAGTEPGSGQTVGLIDIGIDTGHDVFAGKTVSEHFFSGATDETGDRTSHGTAVASVIVGRPSDAFTASVTAGRGAARGADVAMFAIRAGSSSGNYVPISLAGLNGGDNQWASRLNHVINWSSGGRSIDFVNMSVGYNGIIDQYSAQDLRDNFGDTIAALAQMGASEKTVFVWAAGNAHGDPCDPADFPTNPDICVEVSGNRQVDARSAEILAGLPARIPELRGHSIAVVAVAPDSDDDGDYEIASFSNRCGIAADWCLAAPGVRVRAAYFGPDPNDSSPGARGAYNANGTSFAAPMVTGGLVVMKHYFRDQLSNTALVARLLATANKQGIYTDRAILGQSLMDLGAATTPVGVTSVALGDRVDGRPGDNLAGTRFALGDPLGDGLTQSLAGLEIVAFDSMGAPFWFHLDDFAGAAPGPPAAARLRARLRSLMAPLRAFGESGVLQPGFSSLTANNPAAGPALLSLGVFEAPSLGTDGGHLSLAGQALVLGTGDRDGLSIVAFSTEGIGGRAPATGAALSWRPSKAPVTLRSGMVAERETMLGSTAAGAFGRISANSAFAGIKGHARIGSWRLGAGAELGTVRSAVRGGILAGVSPLTTSAFTLRAEKKLADEDSLLFSISQSLRVEAGRARLSVPVGRTKDGQVLRSSVSADLEPTGRQIDLTAQWRRSLGTAASCVWAAPGHRNPATTPPPTPVSASSPAGAIAFETGRLRPASTAPTGHRGSVGTGRAERLPDTLRAGIASGHGFSR